ncbi:hypothetical protein H6G97_38725 [Nostoc flagelliforme FACHB-838]|uniref:Uncharacterized protein n=1 Tax=Nostoc flagelliforme FACHB-838 TaxID=2692904 RepID=A0ABR8E1C2_9NOSO|nr:COP23 domain-containing protein [Nostoc flagelliforme]MBD2535040.1 hypothetical protein [Nostoc flagelliforme FACHB-838]
MKSKLAAPLLLTAIAFGSAVSPAIAQYANYYPPVANPNSYPNSYPPVANPGSYPNSYPPVANPSSYPASPAPATPTSFICGQVGGLPATLVQANGRILPSPLIVWQTASNDMSPQQRCQMVSQRMTVTVAQNGGKLSTLLLTTGKVNGFSVICFVNAAESCNPSNVIITLLRGENARNPGNVLARIVRFGRSAGSNDGIRESGGIESSGATEEIIPSAINLEEAVNQLAGETGAMPTAPIPSSATPTPGVTTPNPAPGSGASNDI